MSRGDLFLSSTFALLIMSLISCPLATQAFECREISRIHQSKRFDCSLSKNVLLVSSQGDDHLNVHTFHVLELEGTYAEITYDHGYLLSKEAAAGIIEEVNHRFQKELHRGSLAEQKLKSAVAQCYFNRIRSSVSLEFMRAAKSFYQGLQAGARAQGEKFPYSYEQLLMSGLGVELSIASEGLSRRAEEDPLGTYSELAATCGLEATVETATTFLNIVNGVVGGVASALKWGCLGFVAPSNFTQDGALLHARNLDADLVESWNRAPTLFIVHERGYYRYVAPASAGMMYPGGVSGFNEKGISVSLHEMSTTHYKTFIPNQKGMIAPFLQERILREAASVDEAVAILKSAGHFGGWSFFISDGKTDEVASIEVTGDRVEVARRTKGQWMGQTNHFLGDHMQDQFFTYNFNKLLESESRLSVISQGLEADHGKENVEWAIEHLAGHQDQFEGFRSFGRTATKVYTVMSTIAVPQRHEFWVTMGDLRPASHSHFLGFQIDFEHLGFVPLGEKRTKAYENIPSWERSLSYFSSARLMYDEGKFDLAVLLLSESILFAKKDGIDELPYFFMRARVSLVKGDLKQALEDFQFLWDRRTQLHPYQQSLVAMYSVISSDRSGGVLSTNEREFRLNEARRILSDLNRAYGHFDLNKKLKFLRQITSGQNPRKLPEIDFVTIE